MIVRLMVALAALVLLLALILVCVKAGKKLAEAEMHRQQGYIDPDTYHRLGNLVRALLAPPAHVDDYVVLPERLRREASELIKKIGTAPRLVRDK